VVDAGILYPTDLGLTMSIARSREQGREGLRRRSRRSLGVRLAYTLPPFFLHWLRNLARSFPCSPFASACVEQALETSDCTGFVAFGLATVPAEFVVVAGAVVVVDGVVVVVDGVVAVCAIAPVPMRATIAAAVNVLTNRMVISSVDASDEMHGPPAGGIWIITLAKARQPAPGRIRRIFTALSKSLTPRGYLVHEIIGAPTPGLSSSSRHALDGHLI
jgi:hypothetical protein